MNIPKNERLGSTALAAIVAFALNCKKDEETHTPDLPNSRLSESGSDARFQLYNEGWNSKEPAPKSPGEVPPTEPAKINSKGASTNTGNAAGQQGDKKQGEETIAPGYKILASLGEMPKVLRDRIVYGRETVDQLLALAGCVTQDFSLNEGAFVTDNGVVKVSVTAHHYPDKEQPVETLDFEVDQSPSWTGNLNQMRPQPIVAIATQACLNEKLNK